MKFGNKRTMMVLYRSPETAKQERLTMKINTKYQVQGQMIMKERKSNKVS